MAALPLTLDTLKSPSNESLISTHSPLISPQCLKADALSTTTNDRDTTPERPSNLTIDSSYQLQQQQHSNVTPSSLTTTTTLHGNISPALSSAGSLSPSFLPEMPQWKRDLIQRRKQNVQRTISASSPTALTSSGLLSSSSSSSSPTTTANAFTTSGGLKTSISSSSVRSLVGSNTNIDQLASDGLQQVCSTKEYTKTSLLSFGNTTTKVSKQYNTTTGSCTNTFKPATNIKSSTTSSLSSPLKERAEKLFGGQYTAATTTITTLTTKEEIAMQQQQIKENILQENNKMMEENEEHFEMYRKTKEVLNDETQTTTAFNTNKQQKATRLTGSTYNNITTNTSAASSSTSSTSSSTSSILKRAETDRERLLNTTQQYHNNIIGANVNLVNQSLNKCESERLVYAANTAGNSYNLNNTNNSSTIGGISVSGNLNNSQNNCSNVTNVVKISQKLQENQFIKNEQQLNTKKIIKYKQNTVSGGNNISLDLKSPTKITQAITTSNSTSCLTFASSSSSSSSSSSTIAATTNCAIKKKMVAVQEMKKSTQNSATHLHPITSTCHATNRANNRGGGGDTELDTNEDLSYGPGIVSKLRCRYLSLALRESMEQQRLSKDQLRRSTSLNNLLDNTEDEENCDEEDEEIEDLRDEDVENQGFEYKAIIKDTQNEGLNNKDCATKKTGILKSTANNGQDKRFSNNSQGSNGVGVTFTETAYNKRSRHLKRGNDSLKRARSVEALLSEKSPWHTRVNSSAPTCVTIEDKIHNARERLHLGSDHMPPKRLTSIIDDTERPPPDLVKQTLKMFEATANRRPRSTNRSNSKGEVASKVETFKNIIKEQKPVVTFPKPLSPTKKLNTPILHKPLKTSTPQANDLLQSPLGRKTMMAVATSVANTNDCLTPLKTNNTLSDHTPDIIPRQKFNNERDFKQNKEIFSSKEKFLTSEREFESPINNIKRDLIKEKYEVDSPITALANEMEKLKLSENKSAATTRKNDNTGNVSSSSDGGSCSSDNHDTVNNMGSVGGVGGGDNNSGDACQRHNNKYPYNNSNNDFVNEETTQEKELNISSLKNENDKIINNKTKSKTNNEATSSSPSSSTIETKNEATVNNYNDSLTKASSPPPSSSDLSDVGENYDDDENGGLKTTKRITRTALDNIAKAGYTQQFKFNTTTSQNNSSTSASNTNSSLALTTGKQIGVIRPLLNTQQQQKAKESNMETLKQHSNTTTSSLTSREIEKNRINDLKKFSTTSGLCNATQVTSSPSASLDHQVIKPTHTSSPNTASSSSCSSVSSVNNAAASGFTADADTVISASNSPLWAMRKRRQTPPAAPAENTSMVFNFSNRKEVPDYIENDGVIFRRKRELPKPNESGFVLLGDLSVETSTDMDYDDFSMCPPSPCDVEFVNANIVIDGKSSIRQKSKDATFRVQFNDTLTSTFEYPSEASLIVDESFSAYNESYTQPIGSSSSSDDFTQAFQNLNLENATTTTHHHVADEIIQLPTLNSSSPAVAAATNTNSPTKNILGNLPLDYPDLQKGIQLTTATTPTTQTPNETTTTTEEHNNEVLQQRAPNAIDQKKSRKDLKLPLGLGLTTSLQKPPLSVKRFQIMSPTAAGLIPTNKLLHSKNLPINLKSCEEAKQQQPQLFVEQAQITNKADVPSRQRKTPRVLNNPQYACFLQEAKNCLTKPIQRSRSNEFHKTFTTLSVSATVSRSNSLRNLEYIPAKRTTSAIEATALCFPPEVNSNNFLNNLSEKELAKDPVKALKSSPITQFINKAKESPSKYKNPCAEPPEFSQSLNNLTDNSYSLINLKENKSRSVDSFEFTNLKLVPDLKEKLESCCLTQDEDERKKFKSNTNIQKFPLNNSPLKTRHLASSHNGLLSNTKAGLPNKDARTKVACENLSGVEKIQENKQHAGKNVKRDKTCQQDLNVSNENNSLVTQNDFNLRQEISKDSLSLAENTSNSSVESQIILDLESTLFNTAENQLKKSATSTLKNTKTSVGVSLTVNSKYVTDYRSKITKNLPHAEIKKSAEFLSKSLKTNLNRDDVQEINEKPRNFKYTSPNRLLSKSDQNISEMKANSLQRNEETFNSSSVLNEINANDNLTAKGKSKSADALNLTFNSKEISNNCSQSLNNVNFDANKNNLEEENNLDLLDILPKSNENLTDNFESTSLEQLKQSKPLVSDLKSLQMSTDSLDQFEDAQDKTEENKSLTDLEASEILEDIAIGFNTSTSLLDFNKLLGLKRSKTAYCLQSLEKSFSLESEDQDYSLQSDDTNYMSACNTLESKCPLKSLKPSEKEKDSNEPNEILEAPEVPPDVVNKKPKTLRLKTSEKILNFTNMASQNVSSYSSFRKSKSFYKNASKTFKNSLRFYETFNEKLPEINNSPQSSIKRSCSLKENPTKKSSELNRKLFSKSSKIMRKVKNLEESPTENSYSFEYFDAQDDGLKRQLVNINNRKESDKEIFNEENRNSGLNENNTKLPELQENLQALAAENKAEDNNSTEATLLAEKPINLKPISNDFYFNASPRPFKRIYEATTLVGMEEAAHKHLEIGNRNNGSFSENQNLYNNTDELSKSCTVFERKPNLFSTQSVLSLTNLKDSRDPSSLALLSSPTELENFSSKRAHSFSSYHGKSDLDYQFKKTGSFNMLYSKNVYQKVETFNRTARQFNNDNFSKSNNDLNKINNNLEESDKFLQINATNNKSLLSKMAQKSSPEKETFTRNDDSSRFSFTLTKFSGNSPKFVDNSPVKELKRNSDAKIVNVKEKSVKENGFSSPENYSNNSCNSSKSVDKSPAKEGVTKRQTNSDAKTENLIEKSVLENDFSCCKNVSNNSTNTFNHTFSSNSFKFNKFDKYNNKLNNVTPTTTFSPTTTTLTFKDLKKTTTTTSSTTTLTNFPIKVVDINSFKPSTAISYRNCSSFSSSSSTSLRITTNKSYTTAKYQQQNPKATRTETTMISVSPPAPPLKCLATKINPPKVIPRRVFINAPKTTTLSSTATSSTCFKASSSSTCTSANNNNVAPLRKRIPGNTLYYV